MKAELPVSYGVTDELTLSVMTLRKATLLERIEAAGIAGFQGIGWRLEDFIGAERDGLSASAVVRLLRAAKMRAPEIEFFREWIGREDDAAYRAQEDRLFDLAGRLGSRHINVAVFEEQPPEKIVASLKLLSKRAADHKLIVQLEFMPYTPPVNSLQRAWEIIRQADEPNAGLLIDAWHWGRTNSSAESLHSIPPERITGIQLSDDLAHPLPEADEESKHDRSIPGTGALNLPLLLRTLAEHGVNAPLSVEVMSDELDSIPPVQAARAVAVGTRSVLWKAAWQSFEHEH
jgi:sugar phosphate isomerase/epimerase